VDVFTQVRGAPRVTDQNPEAKNDLRQAAVLHLRRCAVLAGTLRAFN